MTRGLGYRPDPAAPREGDLTLAEHPGFGIAPLPDEDLHLLPHVQGILDQGEAEDCVGVSLAQACQIQLSAEGLPAVLPSGPFIWYNARESQGDALLNVGTLIYSGVQAIRDFGLPADRECPLEKAQWDFAKRPSALAYQRGYDARFGVELYRVDQTEDAVKAAVGLGPLVFGTMVTRAFTELGEHSAPIDPPAASEDIAGGHAMTIAGYDRGGARVPQTWGLGVGNSGWYWVSWDYVLSDLTSEIVLVRFVPRLEAA